MTAIVHLVRHCAHGDLGERLSGRLPGLALSDAGAAQAARLAAGWARRGGVGAVQASPRLRARQTAAAIGQALGVAVEETAALDEIDFGDWTGRAFADLAPDPAWQAWNAHRGAARVPGGETMAAAADRAFGHIEMLGSREGEGTVLCVSHCDVIRGVVARCLGLPLDHVLRFDVDPGSITTIAAGAWGTRLLSLNREEP